MVGRRDGGFVEPKVVLPEEEVVEEAVVEETKLEEQKEGEEEEIEHSTRPESTSTHKPHRKRRRVGSPPAHVIALEEESGKVVVEAKRRMYFWGRVYLGWVVVWGLVATLLWAGFYPPA